MSFNGPPTEADQVDILVLGGWVITVDSQRRVIRDGAVAIRGDKISAVGKRAELERDVRAARTIDARGSVVLPGLVNGHRHLLCTAKGAQPDGQVTLQNLKGFVYPSFAALREEDMYWYTRHATAEMIRFGTTTFEEPGCTHLERVIDTIAESGMRCRIGPWTWDTGGPAAENQPDWLLMDTDAAVKRLEDGLETVRAFDHPNILPAVTIEGVGTCSDALNVAAADLAAATDTLCVLHKATSQQEVELERRVFGHRPVEHMARIGALNEYVLMNHVTCIDLDEVDIIADSGARISQNPSSAVKLSKGTTQTGKWPELLARGVPIALGTDAENASNHADIVRSMYLAALLPRDARIDPRAVTAEQAIEMGTRLGAKALRMPDIGSLEVGKQGDLVVFDTDDFDWRPLHNPISNLVYGVTGHSADTVICGGEILMEGKVHTRVDVEEARARVEEIDRRKLVDIGIEPVSTWPVV